MNLENGKCCCPFMKKKIPISQLFPKTPNDNIPLVSTMRAEYRIPKVQKEKKLIGLRRAKVQQALLEQIRAEVEREHSKPDVEYEVCTEYDGNFNADGFVVQEHDEEQFVEITRRFYNSQDTFLHKICAKSFFQLTTHFLCKKLDDPGFIFCVGFGGAFIRPCCEATLTSASDKYPLYNSEPMTFYRYKLVGTYGDGRLDGRTYAKDLNNPFKRSSRFTKPLDEQLEEVD